MTASVQGGEGDDPAPPVMIGVTDSPRALRMEMLHMGVVTDDLSPLASAWVDTEDGLLRQSLFTMIPFPPRETCELWSRSVPGAADGYFSK